MLFLKKINLLGSKKGTKFPIMETRKGNGMLAGTSGTQIITRSCCHQLCRRNLTVEKYKVCTGPDERET